MPKSLLHHSIVLLIALACTQCSMYKDEDGLPSYVPDIHAIEDPTPKHLPRSNYGNPRSYVAVGKRYYVLKSADGYEKEGIASWYGTKFHGRLTSSREPYNMFAMTAASPELPIPTFVRVKNLDNGREIIVKINDRGPFAPNRIIDLSYVAARKLDMIKRGTARVRVTAINPSQPIPKSNKQLAQIEDDEDTIKINNPEQPKQIYLQLGSFSQPQNAKQLQKQLQATLQEPVQILTISSDKQATQYKVMVGPLKSMDASLQLATKLQSLGYHGHIQVNR